MCERFEVSDRAGAAFASAVLKDFGVIDDGNLADVIDRSKLRRERQKYKQKLRAILKLLMQFMWMVEKMLL